MLPGVGVALPGLVAGLTGPRDREGLPQQGAGVGVKRIEMSAGAAVAARPADDELVVDDKWGRCQRAVGGLEIVELDGFHELAGLGLGPEDLAVAGNGNDEVLIQRDAPVRGNKEVGLVGPGIHLQGNFGLGRFPDIDLVDGAEAIDDVHGAIVDKGRALMATQGDVAQTFYAAEGHGEGNVEILDIVLIDLVQLGITMRGIVLIDHKPVLRLLVSVDEARWRYLPRYRP